MSDAFANDFFARKEDRDPTRAAQKDLNRPLPKKFYSSVATALSPDGWRILLDDKPVRTPGGAFLVLPTQAAAEAAAEEWRGQKETIDPRSMPLTRLANSAIDGVARDLQGVADDMKKYLRSDLVCYRAASPQSLTAAQAAAWDPVLNFAHKKLDAPFQRRDGVVFQDQPPEALKAGDRAIDSLLRTPLAPFQLAALHTMTTLTGSALIALAYAYGALNLANAWSAANVDEDHQLTHWGEDGEARARQAARYKDMKAAAQMLGLADERLQS